MNRRKEPFNNVSEDSRPRAYLLGHLSGEERQAFEEQLFNDAALWEDLQLAETDLFDDAAAGRLQGKDLEAWHRYLRSQPHLRPRTNFAEAWKRRTARKPFPWSIFLPKNILVAPVIAFLAAFLFLIQYQPSRPKVAPVTIAFQLQAGALRSSEAPQILRIPANANFVQLEFSNPGAASTVRLRHVDSGSQTWRGPLNANVPREAFLPGDMIATLLSAAGEELADCTFRVESPQ